MQLAADDLAPGLFVTLLETQGPSRPDAPGAGGHSSADYTGAGAVLRVISVSLPFVLVQNMTPGMLRGPRMFPVDLRRSKLSTLSNEYVRAAIGEPPSPREPISLIDAGVIERPEPPAESQGGASSKDAERTPSEQDFGGGIYFLGGS